MARSWGDSKEAAPIENVTEVNLPDQKLINTTTEQSQNSAVDMGRSRDQPDKKLAKSTTVQSHNSAADRGVSNPDDSSSDPEESSSNPEDFSSNSEDPSSDSEGQPDKKLASFTSVQSHNSAADRGFSRGAAQMPPGSIDLFKIKST